MAPSARSVPGTTLALTFVLLAAAVAASLAAGRPGARGGAGAGRSGAAAAAVSWARDRSGRLVPVSAAHEQTPLHPELVTHPETDGMGSGALGMALASATSPRPATTAGRTPSRRSPATVPDLPSRVLGIDVSSHQPSIDWSKVAPHVDFVYAKATEGTYYVNPLFENEYGGSYDHGLIRGAYHFAVPSNSSGTAQADYFIAHGGAWSPDGRTLPGALDIEYNPYGPVCYGLSPAQMVSWIKNFVTEYAAKEHAFPVIYSSTDWWKTCTGDSAAFANNDPFWVANYARTGGTLPSGWDYYSFWQYSDSGAQPGDQDVFNGAYAQLSTLAANG